MKTQGLDRRRKRFALTPRMPSGRRDNGAYARAAPATFAAALVGLLCSGASLAQTGDKQPTLNLFPTQIVDNVKETGDTAKKLEDDLQGVVQNLDQQMQLYRQSKCEGAPDDQGCQQISQQMAEAYRQMLDSMAAELPKMKSSVELTRSTLEKRLASELGWSRTGADLQRLLRRDAGGASSAERTRPRHEGVRLSDRFRQYYQLVAQNSQRQSSMALVGAQMYLDLQETSQLIDLTQEQLQHSRLLVNLNASFGTITPKMEETVSGVKQVLFGESGIGIEDSSIVPASTAGTAGAEGADRKQSPCSEFDPDC